MREEERPGTAPGEARPHGEPWATPDAEQGPPRAPAQPWATPDGEPGVHREAAQPGATPGAEQGPQRGPVFPGAGPYPGPVGGPPAGPLAGPPPYPGPYGAPPPDVRWIVPPGPGTRYDHLARTPVHRWWRPVVGSVLVACGYLVVAVVVLVGGALVAAVGGVNVFGADDQLAFSDPLLGLALTLVSLAVALPIVYGTAWLIQRRPPGTLSSVLGRLRWRWLLRCLPVALAAGVLGQLAVSGIYALGGESVTDAEWAGWDAFLPGILVTLFLVPFQAASEEYIFRGWLIQAFGAFFRTPWPGILLGAAGFTALHGYTGWGIVDIFSFGALMGWLAVRTGGLEAPIALHTVNNVLSLGLSSATGTLDDALEQGAVAWQSLAGSVVQLGLFAVVVLYLVRKHDISTTSPARPGTPGAVRE